MGPLQSIVVLVLRSLFQVYLAFKLGGFYMQGYALLCVGFPTSDLEVETQDEDEVTYS